MPHSVGVRRISSPSRRTVLAARSTVKSGVVTTAAVLGGGDAAERGAEPGEELVHAEGLGDVVVGAGVEGGDLVAFGAAGRQDDDRHGGPAAEAADDVEAAHAGEAEVEDDGVGMVLGGQDEGVLAGGGGVGLVAAGAQVGGEGPQDRRLRRRRRGSGRRSRCGLQLDDHRRAAAGGVLDGEVAADGPGEAAGDGQAEPDAGAAAGVGVVEPLERLEDLLALVDR